MPSLCKQCKYDGENFCSPNLRLKKCKYFEHESLVAKLRRQGIKPVKEVTLIKKT